MELIEVTYDQFAQVIPEPYHAFNKSTFNSLNANKYDQIHCWLFKDGKYRLGLICGEKNSRLVSPFSAPFGGFSFLRNDISIGLIDDAIDVLIDRSREKCILSISITLPPLFYEERFISKVLNSLYRKNFIINSVDVNYAYDLRDFSDRYVESIWRNARKNLKTALEEKLKLVLCEDGQSRQRAYEIIKYNREIKRYPLKLSWDEILKTSSIVPIDFFIVSDNDDHEIAAAIVFHIREKEIVQVVYWGDKPEYSEKRPMNFMAYKVFEFYNKKEYRYVDIGPSSEKSSPNYGLCEFKESIGCFISPKFSMIFEA